MHELGCREAAMHESEAEIIPPVRPDTVVVLLVDDQVIIGEAVRRMLLDQPDILFHHCTNPSEALEAARRLNPTVILQDLIMPDVDGLTLVSRYRTDSTTRNIPIIVLSSKEDPVIKRDAFRGGANDYLVKLPDKVELVARIRLHSKAYLNQIQRDEAYRNLSESQRHLVVSNNALAERIGELQAVRDELSRMVSTDSLTGLCSRRRWFELAAVEFTRCRRYGRPLAFLMTDLDFFKRINDTYGHDAGDEVIRQFARVLRDACRQSDVAGRIGGEEFAMLLPETPAGGAKEVARRIVAACRELDISTPAGHVRCSCSVGVAEATEVDGTIEGVLRRADSALYDAKQAGRDGWSSSPRAPRPVAASIPPGVS
jgi:two-component system, chemotaxis family, response regulator WspR